MTKVYLGELLKTIKQIESKATELYRSRRDSAYLVYTAEEKEKDAIVKPEKDILIITNEIIDLQYKIRTLRRIVTETNLKSIVDKFNISMAEAILLLQQLQSERSMLKEYTTAKPLVRNKSYSDKTIEYTEVNFNIDEVKSHVQDLEERIKQLQLELDRTNLTISIDVDENLIKY